MLLPNSSSCWRRTFPVVLLLALVFLLSHPISTVANEDGGERDLSRKKDSKAIAEEFDLGDLAVGEDEEAEYLDWEQLFGVDVGEGGGDVDISHLFQDEEGDFDSESEGEKLCRVAMKEASGTARDLDRLRAKQGKELKINENTFAPVGEALVSCVYSVPPPSVRTQIEVAQLLGSLHQRERAVQVLLLVKSTSSDSAFIMDRLGDVFNDRNVNDFENALSCFERAIELNIGKSWSNLTAEEIKADRETLAGRDLRNLDKLRILYIKTRRLEEAYKAYKVLMFIYPENLQLQREFPAFASGSGFIREAVKQHFKGDKKHLKQIFRMNMIQPGMAKELISMTAMFAATRGLERFVTNLARNLLTYTSVEEDRKRATESVLNRCGITELPNVSAFTDSDTSKVTVSAEDFDPSGSKEVWRAQLVAVLGGCLSKQKVLKDYAKRSSNVNLPSDVFRFYPLHYLSAIGDPKSVENLLRFGADPHVRTSTGLTPLHIAAMAGNTAVFPALLGALKSKRRSRTIQEIHDSLVDNYDRTAMDIVCLISFDVQGIAEAMQLVGKGGAQKDKPFVCRKKYDSAILEKERLLRDHHHQSGDTQQESEETKETNGQEKQESCKGGWRCVDDGPYKNDTAFLSSISNRARLIPEFDADDISPLEFLRDFLSLQRPVIIRNAMDREEWASLFQRTTAAALSKSKLPSESNGRRQGVSPDSSHLDDRDLEDDEDDDLADDDIDSEGLEQQMNGFGSELPGDMTATKVRFPYLDSFGLDSTLTSYKDFIQYMKTQAPNERDPSYMLHAMPRKDANMETPPEGSEAAANLPSYTPLSDIGEMPDALDPQFSRAHVTETMEFYVGPARSGTPIQFRSPVINVCLYGKRRWFLSHPAVAFYSTKHIHEWVREDYPRLTSRFRPFEVIQNPTDAIFVPHFWSQGVINLEDSVGYTVEIDYGVSGGELSTQSFFQ